MSKYGVSKILVMETIVMGLLSLGFGLLLGVLASQGLSILTAALFDVNISQYEFIFSSEAIWKTVSYFGISFVLVILFNTVVVSRYKLIDLLYAGKKNESLKIRKTSTSIVLFLFSIALLGVSYVVVWKYGLQDMNIVWVCVGLGAGGTLLFFMSLSGFALKMLQGNHRIYYKGLNMFILRQINSKINSTFISMSIICLMLFFTIGVLSTGFSMKAAMERDLKPLTPYDASLIVGAPKEVKSMEEALEKLHVDVSKYGEYVVYQKYGMNKEMNQREVEKIKQYEDEEGKRYRPDIDFIKRTDYEKIMKLQKSNAISLTGDEVLIISNASGYEKTLQRYMENQPTLLINNQSYPISTSGIQKVALTTQSYPWEQLVVVVPDDVVKNLSVRQSIVNIQYGKKDKQFDQEIEDLVMRTHNGEFQEKYGFYLEGQTKTNIYQIEGGSRTMITYIGIYLGVVFLISSAAILALQQLSEASDNLERYVVLKKAGVSKREIHRAIFAQIFIYFMMPLSLAIVHSFVGVPLVNREIIASGKNSVLIPAFVTGGIIVTIYAGYFMATYKSYKNIVK